MKTILIALFASCWALLAQTNTDSSGYVTNANLLTPFTLTNSSGEVITDAVLVKLTANQFIYKTSSGGIGMSRLDSLSKDLQVKFGYDSKAAQAADEIEKERRIRGQLIAQQQREAFAVQAQENAIWKQVNAHKMDCSRVDSIVADQITGDGILASFNYVARDKPELSFSNPYFIKDYPNKSSLVDGNAISGRSFYKIGNYAYKTVMGSGRTIDCLTCSPNEAYQYYLKQAAILVEDQNKARQLLLEQQQKQAAIPEATRNAVWRKVQSHKITSFRANNGFVTKCLDVDQITKEGILGIAAGTTYFLKDCPKKDKLTDFSGVSAPFYEIGTYTYKTVMGSSKTVRCLTCSENAAFEYYLDH